VQDFFKTHYINESLRAQVNLKSIYYLGLDIKKSEMVTELVQKYLLSTDFFLNKMDESKPVKYLGVVYTPYAKPCFNPFSSLYYPQATV
jgi:hypothetical protein